MPAVTEEKAGRGFTGRFTITVERGALVLARASGDLQLIFNDVAPHELPASLVDVRIHATPPAARDATSRRFELTSAGRSYVIDARSLQVQERAALYGNVIPLPRFALRQRVLWSALLWAARFEWGQTLIRRLTARKTPAPP